MDQPPTPIRRLLVAHACRILGARGLAEDVLGHVSLRTGPDRLLVRCRGPQEEGLFFTRPADVREVDLDGRAVGADAGRLGGAQRAADPRRGAAGPPGRRRRRPLPSAVGAARRARGRAAAPGLRGVPHPGGAPGARRGAGLPAVGAGPPSGAGPGGRRRARGQDACWSCAATASPPSARGRTPSSRPSAAPWRSTSSRGCRWSRPASAAGPPELTPEDVAELPDLGGSFNDVMLFRHHLARLRHEGLLLD